MSNNGIPEWSAQGVLPPVDELSPTTFHRSPYRVSLLDFVGRFGVSDERISILKGFLDYRAQLHRQGLVAGFQWLDGSFCENIEQLEGRPPKDIDVVTFLEAISGNINTDDPVFDQASVKNTYHVDGYLVALCELPLNQLVDLTVYWYSMWSHRRNRQWKGFIQIDLNPMDDVAAREYLESLSLI